MQFAVRKMTNPDNTLQDIEEGAEGMTKYSKLILEFMKREVFKDRQNISVEEAITLVAAFTDISVNLLAKFHKEPLDSSKSAAVGRDVFKYMVSQLGFDTAKLRRPSFYT